MNSLQQKLIRLEHEAWTLFDFYEITQRPDDLKKAERARQEWRECFNKTRGGE